MADYTLAEATELLDAAKAQVLELTRKLATAGYSRSQLSVQRQQLAEAREHLQFCRELYHALAGDTAGRTLARPRQS